MLEAARANRVRRVLISAAAEPDARLDEVRSLVTWEAAPPERLDRLAPGLHQGVVGELHPRHFLDLKALLASTPDLIVALDSIQDPQNLGAILRTAEAAGAQAAILPEHRAAGVTPAVVKASSGASEHLPLCRVPGLPSAISEIKRNGVWCLALDPRGEALPWECDFTVPVCVVVGAEGQGVHRLVLERCDRRVRLPMSGRVASLNASAAAAMLLFEVVRQRALASA